MLIFKKNIIMKKNIFLTVITVLIMIFPIMSCTDLTENVFDRLTEDNFYKNEKDIMAAITPVYTNFRGLLEWRKWWDFEETTDIVVTPRAAWFDGGIYIRLHTHTWKSSDPHFSDLWRQAFAGISNCNRVIYQLNRQSFEVKNKENFIAELEVVRAGCTTKFRFNRKKAILL